MTVIPFPTRVAPPPPAPAEPPDSLRTVLIVISALHALGEPASAREICDLIAELDPEVARSAPEPAVVASLRHYSREDAFAYFRPVTLRAQEAWAFTRGFRDELRRYGLDARLREGPG